MNPLATPASPHHRSTDPVDPSFLSNTASFSQWVHRVLSTTNVPLSIVFLALLFIHRLRSTIPAPPAGSEFIVFIAGLMVAMKSPQGCDNTYTNKGWHRISKVPLHLLNAMELQMLISLRFDMWVSEQGFSVWLQFIEGAIAQHMGQSFSSSVVQPVYPKRSASLNQSSPTAGTATRSHHRHTRNLSDGHLSRPAPLRPPTLQNMMAASAYPSPTNLSPASATSTSSSSGVHIADMSGDAFSAAPRSVSPIVIPVVGHAKVTSLNTRQYHHQQFLHSQDKQRLYVHHHHPGHPIEPPSFDSMQRRAPAHLRYHPSPPSSHHGSPELAGPVVPILPPQLR
ncbi:hypothetical protein BC829DRAFT_413081 [Chytridium lagenaria]|nr:hypothetical protein BC829DRAFT_413081 [Chytridium lagenaria]